MVLLSGYAWAEDKEHCEEYGRMLQADSAKVSAKAKKRGLPQVCFIFPLNSVNTVFATFHAVVGVIVAAIFKRVARYKSKLKCSCYI